MGRYLLGRLANAAVALATVLLLVFFLIHLVPGDPARAMLGEGAASANVAALRAKLGLDRPLPAQLTTYVVGLVHMDLGRSLRSGRPVAQLLAKRCPQTLLLGVSVLLLAGTLAIPFGIFAALGRHPVGSAFVRIGSSVAIVLPAFVLGPALVMVFSLALGLLPVSGGNSLSHLVLPAVTLGLPFAALLTQLLEQRLRDELRSDYVRGLRAWGVEEKRIMWRHVAPNALVPLISIVALHSGALLSGVVVTETIFGWPGIGRLLVDAIAGRDYPVVQGCVLSVACTYVVVNLAGDMIQAALDPRLRDGLR
ncbi:MAG: ABC transporter permease [Acidobacteria bacterium]|nr:ABC transporter permease [Acidobacteriota bacterium]